MSASLLSGAGLIHHDPVVSSRYAGHLPADG
jgi:hypothetical protein